MSKTTNTTVTEKHIVDGKEITITATVHKGPETFTVVECQDAQGRFRGFFISSDRPQQAIKEMKIALEHK